MTATPPSPPRAECRPTVTEWHGHQRRDDYAWLRADNWREAMQDPTALPEDVRGYLDAENAYTDAVMAESADFRSELYRELRARIREDDSTVPAPDGDWLYYTRFREGGQHPILCRRPRNGGDEAVLLDGDAEAAGRDYFRLGSAEHSPDHRYLAYSVDGTGAEVFQIRVRDLKTGEDLPDRLDSSSGDVAWAADSRTLFFTVLNPEHRPKWVHRHRLGEPPAAAAIVYDEPDAGFFVGVEKTESGRYVLINCHDHTTSEVHAIRADRPDASPVVFLPRERDVEYEVSDHGDRWIILTNRDGAEDFRIVTAPLEEYGPENWRELVAHRPGCLIQGMLVFERWLVRQELENAVPRLVVRDMTGGEEHAIAFDEACYSIGIVGGYEYATDTLRFGYSSYTTPARIFDYDMRTRERTLRKAHEVPSGHRPEDYVAHRLDAVADDGETVPITLFHHRDVTPGPDTPLLLYGYGAYGISDLPGFSANRLSLVARGFVYATAHVRGGMERGYRWYRDGKLGAKQNTFSDTIACAEALIARGYTGVGRITLHGGSAGGMLVGAVLNQRPDLFGAAVADVPFVDVLNTMLDASLPLTPPEWPEWGNPVESADDYRTILSYSPYDNVAALDYPPLLVTAGVSDPRVTYWEPAKWVARLRATRANDAPLLLRTNMSAGHGGASGRFDYLEEVAFRYAFILGTFGTR